MEQTKASSLIDMANGAIKERLDYEMGRVIQNISCRFSDYLPRRIAECRKKSPRKPLPCP